MPNLEVTRYRQRLDALFGRVSALSHDLELQAHWARYLCILASGFVEESVRILLSDYVQKRADTTISRYVNAQLDGFQNPKAGKILDLLRAFDIAWAESVEQFLGDERKDAIDSIVNNRHQIAHGRNVGISYVTIKNYYEKAVEVVEFIEKTLR
jgi:hypothetical protein